MRRLVRGDLQRRLLGEAAGAARDAVENQKSRLAASGSFSLWFVKSPFDLQLRCRPSHSPFRGCLRRGLLTEVTFADPFHVLAAPQAERGERLLEPLPRRTQRVLDA